MKMSINLPAGAVASLKGMGEWLAEYGEAIYGTRICAPYKKDGIGFTQKDGKVYAIQTFLSETEPVEDEVWIPYAGEFREVTALGDDKVQSFAGEEGGCRVILERREHDKAPIARVFCLK